MESEGDGDTNYNWHALYNHQRTDTGIGGFENKRTSRDHPNENQMQMIFNIHSFLKAKNHQNYLVS